MPIYKMSQKASELDTAAEKKQATRTNRRTT